MEDEEDQSDEILALNEICCESIKSFKLENDSASSSNFEDFEAPAKQFFSKQIDQSRPGTFSRGGSLYVAPDLNGQSIFVKYEIGDEKMEFNVRHLLPFRMDFMMPKNYPSSCRPSFDISTSWLSEHQLDALKKKLIEIWDENSGTVVLFLWQNFLREECFNVLGFSEGGEVDISPVIRQNSIRNGTVVRLCHESEKETFGIIKDPSGEELYFSKRNSKVAGISEGDEVDFLMDLKSPSCCNRSRAINVSAASGKPKKSFGSTLVEMMKDFHADMEEREFNQQVFNCDICFVQKNGSKCMRFPGCDHVYCQDCMGSYFAVQINQGMMNNLTCPAGGCSSQALPTQVKKLVSNELYELYDRQMLATTLEAMTDVKLCPKLDCQCPTIIDSERNMGQCPKCEFAFCVYCNMAFHGLAGCKVNSKEKLALIKDYINGSKKEQEQLEKRYGKKTLINFRDRYLSDVYIQERAKKCPNCQTAIEKSEGCNKMTCYKCGVFFCYLCGARLPKANPYVHYNSLFSECNGQLFEGDISDEFVEVDDEDFLEMQEGDEVLLREWLARF